jgi:hypothetical protein
MRWKNNGISPGTIMDCELCMRPPPSSLTAWTQTLNVANIPCHHHIMSIKYSPEMLSRRWAMVGDDSQWSAAGGRGRLRAVA